MIYAVIGDQRDKAGFDSQTFIISAAATITHTTPYTDIHSYCLSKLFYIKFCQQPQNIHLCRKIILNCCNKLGFCSINKHYYGNCNNKQSNTAALKRCSDSNLLQRFQLFSYTFIKLIFI